MKTMKYIFVIITILWSLSTNYFNEEIQDSLEASSSSRRYVFPRYYVQCVSVPCSNHRTHTTVSSVLKTGESGRDITIKHFFNNLIKKIWKKCFLVTEALVKRYSAGNEHMINIIKRLTLLCGWKLFAKHTTMHLVL